MAEKKTITLQIPVPIELADDLRKLAKLDERSMAMYCKRALQSHVEDVLGINTKEMKMDEMRKNFLGHALISNSDDMNEKNNEKVNEVAVTELKTNETKKKKRPGKMAVGL